MISSYKALVGGTVYNNFDTSVHTGVNVSNIDSVNAVEQVVTAEAGRLNNGDFTWEFNDSIDDTSYALNEALMSKIKSYATKLVSVGGNAGPVDPTPTPTSTPTPTPTATPSPTPQLRQPQQRLRQLESIFITLRQTVKQATSSSYREVSPPPKGL